jgi:hypothetical protein
MTRSKGPPSKTPDRARRRSKADPFETRVPDSEYLVAYVAQELARSFGRTFWVVIFQIVQEGPFFGLPLRRFYNLPAPGRKLRRGSNLFTEYVVATGRRPPPDPHRLRPGQFLQGCEFLARVVTVTRDKNQVVRPQELHYSRIDALLRRTSGIPPCLRRGTP